MCGEGATYVAGSEDQRLEHKQRHPLLGDRTRRPMLAIDIPEIALVEQRKERMDVKKVLLHKLI
jgi:hypothetical protein